MNYENTVKLVSKYLARELKLSTKEKDKIRFGFELFFSTIISLSFTLIPAIIFGTFKAVICVLIAGSTLKVLAGGIHFKTTWECGFFTAFITNLFGLINIKYQLFFYNNWSLLLLLGSLYIIISLLLWGPSDVPQRPISDKKEIKFFKSASILISIIILIIISLLLYFWQERFAVAASSLVTGLAFQAFTISPLAYRLQGYYYRLKKT